MEKFSLFHYGNGCLKINKKVKGEKIDIGVVLIPINQTSYFEEFLDVWGMKYKTREWTII